ncbi:MAG: hypothetical protein ABSC94_08240 [Polyangiaceae bacterium]|jgi:isoaspartyl peptidase/L-asparaginase-like protein (Ntn-hydrolase superfamily)
MLFAQTLTVDRAQSLWDLGRRLKRGLWVGENNPNDAAQARGHLLTAAESGLPAVVMDEEGRVFAVNSAEGSYIVWIGRVSDGVFRASDWAQ